MPEKNTITSWGAERALVLSKLDDYGDTLNNMVIKVQKLSEGVAILKVKLGYLVAGASVVVSLVVSLFVNYVKAL